MKSKKFIWLAGVSLALFLNACGGGADYTAADQAGQDNVSRQESGQEQAGSGTDGQNADGQTANGQGSDGSKGNGSNGNGQQETWARVVNNGTGFVKKGDEVFFAAGTTLCCYNEQTGKLAEIGTFEKSDYDEEDIKLFYSDGWIYYGHYNPERQDTWVFRMNAETGAKEAVCQGFLEGVSEDAKVLFINRYEDSNALLDIYEGNKLVTELQVEGGGDAIYCGTAGDYVFVQDSQYEGDTTEHRILASRISRPAGLFLVGHMPCLNEDGYWYEYPEITQVLVDGDKAYFSLSYYAGTGMFYNGGFVCEADLTKEDSLREVDKSNVGMSNESGNGGNNGSGWNDENGEDEELFQEIYLWMKDGMLQMGYGLPLTAEYSGEYDGSGIRTYDENGRAQIFYPGLVPPTDEGTFLSEELQNVYLIDGAYYFVWKRLFNDPSQAIGWRPYYETVYAEYDRMDADGTLTVMREQNAELIMTGYVARGAEDAYVYFQPTDIYEDYEGMPMETVSNSYGKVYLAREDVVSDWDEFLEGNLKDRKPLSALTEYGVENFGDTDMEPDGYPGYYSGPEPISSQRFLLRFDREGRLIQIAPDFAG
ncbi:MAG: hypothetical protein IJ794_19575 [Lachnospiraceae bacterium]|nr:hypothetical protein [Lachnospiraceae bacterium]